MGTTPRSVTEAPHPHRRALQWEPHGKLEMEPTTLSPQDFVVGLSILLRGTVHEKLKWAFNLYDINKDGYITKEVRECLGS